MIPIHPDDPDWNTALLCAPRPGARPRLKSRRRPIAKLLDTIRILRYRWLAGGRTSRRYRELRLLEVRHPAKLGAVDDGTLLAREIAQPQLRALCGYRRTGISRWF